jgi:hypothetical protein
MPKVRPLNPGYRSKCCNSPIQIKIEQQKAKDQYLVPTVRKNIAYYCGICKRRLGFDDFVKAKTSIPPNPRQAFGIWWRSQYGPPPGTNFALYRRQIKRYEELLVETRARLEALVVYRAEERAALRAWTALSRARALLKKYAKRLKQSEGWWPKDLEKKEEED